MQLFLRVSLELIFAHLLHFLRDSAERSTIKVYIYVWMTFPNVTNAWKWEEMLVVAKFKGECMHLISISTTDVM